MSMDDLAAMLLVDVGRLLVVGCWCWVLVFILREPPAKSIVQQLQDRTMYILIHTILKIMKIFIVLSMQALTFTEANTYLH